MIAYQDLVVALADWRKRQGLPVDTGFESAHAQGFTASMENLAPAPDTIPPPVARSHTKATWAPGAREEEVDLPEDSILDEHDASQFADPEPTSISALAQTRVGGAPDVAAAMVNDEDEISEEAVDYGVDENAIVEEEAVIDDERNPPR